MTTHPPPEVQTCPRRMQEYGPWEHGEGLDEWIDLDGLPVCSFCGSLHPDEFMRRVRAGDRWSWTDKRYKAYLQPDYVKFYYPHLSGVQAGQLVGWLNDGTANTTRDGALPSFVTVEDYYR